MLYPPMFPAIIKKTLKLRGHFTPQLKPHSCDPRKLAFIAWERSILPIVHDEKKIGAVFDGTQMPGIRQIIRNVQRHPWRR